MNQRTDLTLWRVERSVNNGVSFERMAYPSLTFLDALGCAEFERTTGVAWIPETFRLVATTGEVFTLN